MRQSTLLSSNPFRNASATNEDFRPVQVHGYTNEPRHHAVSIRKFTEFLHDAAPSSSLLVHTFWWRYFNTLCDGSAKTEGGVNHCLIFADKINLLPQQRPLGNRKTNVRLIIHSHVSIET